MFTSPESCLVERESVSEQLHQEPYISRKLDPSRRNLHLIDPPNPRFQPVDARRHVPGPDSAKCLTFQSLTCVVVGGSSPPLGLGRRNIRVKETANRPQCTQVCITPELGATNYSYGAIGRSWAKYKSVLASHTLLPFLSSSSTLFNHSFQLQSQVDSVIH